MTQKSLANLVVHPVSEDYSNTVKALCLHYSDSTVDDFFLLDYLDRIESKIDQSIIFGLFDEGSLVGFVSLDNIVGFGSAAYKGQFYSADAHIVVDRPYWGSGTKLLASSVLDHVFNVLGAYRLQLKFDKNNTLARGLAKRCGFKKEGSLRGAHYKFGKPRALEVWGLIKPDYFQRGEA